MLGSKVQQAGPNHNATAENSNHDRFPQGRESLLLLTKTQKLVLSFDTYVLYGSSHNVLVVDAVGVGTGCPLACTIDTLVRKKLVASTRGYGMYYLIELYVQKYTLEFIYISIYIYIFFLGCFFFSFIFFFLFLFNVCSSHL